MSALALQDYGAVTPAPTDIARAKATINNMFGEPNAMALHLVTMIPIAIAMFLASSNILKKVLYGGGVAVDDRWKFRDAVARRVSGDCGGRIRFGVETGPA